MSDFKRIPILVDAATGKQIDEFGSVVRDNDYFRLLFDETVILCCQFYDVNWIDGVAELNPHRLNPTLTFAALGDSDFDPATPYMFLSKQSQDESNTVNLVGDWFNDETANPLDGQLSFRVDTNTERFTEALQSSSSRQSFYFCVTAVPSGQTATTVLAYFKFKAENRPTTSTGSPASADPEYLNTQEVQALVKSAPVREFSIDGVNLWHSTQTPEDLYYREQRNDGEWSEAVAMVVGPQGEQGIAGTDGTNGISAYQVWLDQGNAGTEADFIASLKGTDGTNGISAYQVWLDQGNAGTEADFIASLKGTDGTNGVSAYQVWLDQDNAGTEADFIASLQGEQGLQGVQGEQGLAGSDGIDGAAGADGTDAFVYVAYASDNAGTDFNLTPSDTLKYRAEIHSTTEIATPSASDFSGAIWVKYIGEDGINGTDGADGADGTNFTVDATGLLSERSNYEAELEGFAFLATDTGDLFLKNSDTSGDWSSAIPFQGPAGSDGTDGADGSSAYQIWLDQGNAGTEADFIASLAGADGANGTDGTDGIDGDSAYQIWLDQGNAGTEADFIASLAGADGTDGSDGAAGADGTDAFVYVAYASDNTGTDFNLTPSDTLKYRAEIHSATALTPVEGDFSGATWVKYIGNDGVDEGGSLDNWQNFYKAAVFPQDWKESVWTNVGSNRPTIDYDQLSVPVWRVDYAIAEGVGVFVTDKLPSGATNLVVEITAQPQTPGATGTDMDWKADIVRYREGVVESSIETVMLGSTAFNAVGITQSSYSVAMSSLTNTMQAGDQLAIILYPNTAASSPKQTDWMVLSVNIGVS